MRPTFVSRLGVTICAALLTVGAGANALPEPEARAVPAASTDSEKIVKATPRLPVAFEENIGQAPGAVRFTVRHAAYQAILGERGMTVSVPSRTAGQQPTYSSLTLEFQGSEHDAAIEGEALLPGRSNFFIGNDPDAWHTGARHFAQVRYSNVYDGVDVVYYGKGPYVEYDLVVAPGADPADIALGFPGAGSLNVDEDGRLIIDVAGQTLVQSAPVIYQGEGDERTLIDGGYVLADGAVAFEVAAYDPAQALVIDPVLEYGTYLGGSGTDGFGNIDIDDAGNAYLLGTTTSPDYPVLGGVQPEYNDSVAFNTNFPNSFIPSEAVAIGDIDGDGNEDLVIGGFDARDELLLNDGFGNFFAEPLEIDGEPRPTEDVAIGDLDGDGNLDVVFVDNPGRGRVYFNNGTADPFAGMAPEFVFDEPGEYTSVALADLDGDGDLDGLFGNENGETIIAINDDIAEDIPVGDFGAVFDVGVADFDGVNGPDLFLVVDEGPDVLILNNGTDTPLDPLLAFFLGDPAKTGDSLAIDDVNGDQLPDAVVTGVSGGPELYINNGTDEPFDDPLLLPAGAAGIANLLADVDGDDRPDYIRTDEVSDISYILNDGTGAPFVTGDLVPFAFGVFADVADGDLNDDGIADFAAVGGGAQVLLGFEPQDVVVTKLNYETNTLIWSTYFGGSGTETFSQQIAVSPDGQVTFSSDTTSTDIPQVNPSQDGPTNLFIARLNADGDDLVYSTYFGGSVETGGQQFGVFQILRGMVSDPAGNILVTGQTSIDNFPSTGPFLPTGRDCLEGADPATTFFYDNAFLARLLPNGEVDFAYCINGEIDATGRDVTRGRGIVLDADNNIYLTGYTDSFEFPVVGALGDTLRSGTEFYEAFVMKLDPDATAITFSTVFGGSFWEFPQDIELDSGLNVVIGGTTQSDDFPTLNAAQDTLMTGGEPANFDAADGFVSKVAFDGSALIFSTYIGGTEPPNGNEGIWGLGVDGEDRIYVTGGTPAPDFPLLNELQAGLGGESDLFVASYAANGTLLYSSYLGGSGPEGPNPRAEADATGRFFIAGDTSSDDAPTENPFQPAQAGESDGYFVIVAPTTVETGEDVVVTPPAVDDDGNPVDSPVTLTFDEVVGEGESSVTVTTEGEDVPDSLGGPEDETQLDIEVEAEFEGEVEVCVEYEEDNYPDQEEEDLDLYKFDDSVQAGRPIVDDSINAGRPIIDNWAKLSDEEDQDTEENEVCGKTDSFSLYAVFGIDESNPLALVDVEARSKGRNAATVTWTRLNAGVNAFNEVYRSDTSGGPYELVGSTPDEIFIDNTVENGETYYYVVRVVTPVATSEDSNEAEVEVPGGRRRR